ncbi:MAG: ArnT family glycosyltransferase [Alphaproteobacteria bacterium]
MAALAALVAVLALAAALRLWAIDFGHPHPLVRPDEKEILEPSFRFARGDFNPKYHVYPGLYLYLVWLWSAGVLAVRGLFTPTPPYPAALLAALFGTPDGRWTSPIVHGRVLAALVGVATVAAVWLVGRRRDGRAVGLVAAALLATCYLHVRDCHSLKAEAFLTFAIVPALAACARLVDEPTGRRGLVAGLWIGIATGMKQPGILLLVPLWAAGVMASTRAGWRRLLPSAPVWLGALAAVALFLATGPYMVLDWPFVWETMSPAIKTVFAPRGEADLMKPVERAFWYHVTTSFRWGTGLLFSLLCVPAIALGARGREPFFVLSTLFTVLWIVTIGVSPVHHVRYLTPILPLLALLVARLLVHLARPLGRLAVPAVAAATVLLAVEPLARAIGHDRIVAASDTRVLANEWLAGRTRPGDTVAVLGTRIWPYGVPVMPRGVEIRSLGDRNGIDPGDARFLLTHEHPLPFSRVDEADLDRLRPRLRLLTEISPWADAKPRGWFEDADAYYAPFHDFEGVLRAGPLVRIYSVAPAAGDGSPPTP